MSEIILKPYEKVENKKYRQPTKLSITEASFKNVNFQAGKFTFLFSGCDFGEITIENLEAINFDNILIQFWNCTIGDIKIDDIKSPNISVNFGSSIISGRIQSGVLKEVSLNNSILNDSLFLLNQNSIRISFGEENLFPIFWRKLFKRNGMVNTSDFVTGKQSYHIHDSKKISLVSNPSKEAKRGVYRMQYMKGDEYKIGYRLKPNDRASLNLNMSIFYSTEVDDTETRISNSILNSLSLKGSPKGTINIESTQIENWYIRDFLPQNEVTFYDISPQNPEKKAGKIEFHKSNLDKVRFDNIGFDSYSVVSFYRTRFAKSTFSSCNFPVSIISFEKFKTLENVHYKDIKPEKFYKDQYELFLQLRLALESGGNFYEAQKLQAISNDALRNIPDISRWDKLILWISSKSNNHGLSISSPLVFLFLFSVLFYLLYLLSLDRLFTCRPFDSSLIGYYFSFIDVTHRSDFLVGKDEFTGWSLAFDFLNKIVVGFFIYQFIAAFRKYGKKV